MARRKSTKNTDNNEENTMSAPTFNPAAAANDIRPTEATATVRVNSGRDKYADNPFVESVRKSRETGETLGLDIMASQAAEVQGWLRDAANKADVGLALRFHYDQDNGEGGVDRQVVTTARALPGVAKGEELDSDYNVHVAFLGKNPRQTAKRRGVTGESEQDENQGE